MCAYFPRCGIFHRVIHYSSFSIPGSFIFLLNSQQTIGIWTLLTILAKLSTLKSWRTITLIYYQIYYLKWIYLCFSHNFETFTHGFMLFQWEFYGFWVLWIFEFLQFEGFCVIMDVCVYIYIFLYLYTWMWKMEKLLMFAYYDLYIVVLDFKLWVFIFCHSSKIYCKVSNNLNRNLVCFAKILEEN